MTTPYERSKLSSIGGSLLVEHQRLATASVRTGAGPYYRFDG